MQLRSRYLAQAPKPTRAGPKPFTGPSVPARLLWTMRNRKPGHLVRSHRLRSKLRKRKRNEREGIPTSNRNTDVRATHKEVEEPQPQAQLSEGHFSFTTTVRVAFEDPTGSQSASNADGGFPTEDSLDNCEDLRSASEGIPIFQTENAIPKIFHDGVRYWTQGEDQIITYALGQRWSVPRIHRNLLPHRSLGALRSYIYRRQYHQPIGVVRERHPWTKWEDDVLLDAQRKGWKFCSIGRDLLPHRTYPAITSRSYFLRGRTDRASQTWSPPTNSMSSAEGALKPLLEETSAVPSRWPHSSHHWTELDDHALTKAHNHGMPYSLIHSETLPQCCAMSIERRVKKRRFQCTKTSDHHDDLLFRAHIKATKKSLNPPASEPKAEATACSRRRTWTNEEDMALIRACDQGWSYARICDELFPQRSANAMKKRKWYLRRLSSKTGKSDTPNYRGYGVILESEAVDDEEYPPLPKEADLKKVKQRNLGQQEGKAREEEHRADHARLRHGLLDKADEASPKLGEEDYVGANDEHLSLPEEEVEDMDTEVDDEDLPHLDGEDEEEVMNYILPDAEDDFEEEAAWKDECDES